MWILGYYRYTIVKKAWKKWTLYTKLNITRIQVLQVGNRYSNKSETSMQCLKNNSTTTGQGAVFSWDRVTISISFDCGIRLMTETWWTPQRPVYFHSSMLWFGAQAPGVRDRGRRNLMVNRRGKKEGMKKTKKNGKKIRQKKNEKSHQHGPHGNRPISTLETDLRVSLWTTSASRFWLHTVRGSSSLLYRKHDKQPECKINFCAVLPAVLRYCPGSTAHRCA